VEVLHDTSDLSDAGIMQHHCVRHYDGRFLGGGREARNDARQSSPGWPTIGSFVNPATTFDSSYLSDPNTSILQAHNTYMS